MEHCLTCTPTVIEEPDTQQAHRDPGSIPVSNTRGKPVLVAYLFVNTFPPSPLSEIKYQHNNLGLLVLYRCQMAAIVNPKGAQ